MAKSLEELKKIACDAIDGESSGLNGISQEIWKNPELNFEEHHAHKVLTDYLEGKGFPVERKHVVDTAFRSVYGEGDGPNVAVLCEYDALPDIGHACGHNLIAEVGIGAAIGIMAAMDAAGKPLGKLSVIGTPAEEGGGGKLNLIQAGTFKDTDIAMMAHPAPFNRSYVETTCIEQLKIYYHGKASHAAAFPHEGINALDAAVMAYNNVSCLRQQMKPTWRVHGVITNGGAKPNIIPEETALEFYIRTGSMGELSTLRAKMDACFRAAAAATGCEVEIKSEPNVYLNVISNKGLCGLYDQNASKLGVENETDEQILSAMAGSTDMGNVSYEVPSIHPMFEIGDKSSMNHTRSFTAVAGSAKAQSYTLTQAKLLALTAVDILHNPKLLEGINNEFKEAVEKQRK